MNVFISKGLLKDAKSQQKTIFFFILNAEFIVLDIFYYIV